MLTVWGRADSSNVQAVMWCAAELGLDVTRHDVGHRFGGTDTPEFLAMNPNGTVPVLRDGDGPALWESGAICRYLASRHGEGSFWPADPVARADVDRWAEWGKVTVAGAFTVPVFWRVVRTPAAERDWPAIRVAVAAAEAKLAIADARLRARPWIAGEDFTLADIQLGHVLHRWFGIGIERSPMPGLEAYHARLRERPAFREHVAVPWDALAAD